MRKPKGYEEKCCVLNPFRAGRIRVRLTVWYVTMIAAILVIYAAGSSALLWWNLSRELDRHGIQDIETVEGLLRFAPDGHLYFDEDYHNHPESKRLLERLLEVVTPNGKVLLRNQRLGQRALGGTPFDREGVGGYSLRWGQLDDGTPIRLFSRRHNIGKNPVIIRIAYVADEIRKPSQQFLLVLVATFPLTLLLAGFAGYVLARKALRPVEEMTVRAEKIDAQSLNERLPVSEENAETSDEIVHLARVFNRMLSRIEQAFEQLRRFTSDASHELRTPLTAIRSTGEIALQKQASADQYRDVIGSMLEEVDRLTLLTENLLAISRADAGQVPVRFSDFAPLRLVEETSALLGVLAEEKNQKLSVSGDRRARVSGDRVLLRQAILNILHNAVLHTPSGGSISIVVEDEGDDWVAMRIIDSGPGIPHEHVPRIFDRFYRVDSSRSAQEGGTGLGLAIAKWAVEAQQGTLSLETLPGLGCTFTMKLHRAAPLSS
jgi:heavy metal sensor kinase